MTRPRREPIARSIGVLAALLAVALSPAFGADHPASALGGELEARLDALEQTYRHLHAHPELSFQERETAALLAERMRALGFAVSTGFGRYDDPERTAHGVVAVMENGRGPRIMLRTDTDALPIVERTGLDYASRATAVDDHGDTVSVMHACGHDLHMTSWLGAAQLLAARRDLWRGTLVMIAQPAEERGAGARALLEAGLYERFGKPDYALALHTNAALPAGTVGLAGGYALANVDSVDIEVRGVGGHGAYPHTTKDPIVLAARIVLGLQTIVSREISPLEPAVVTVGSIHGGTKHNVIPDAVRLQLTVRSYAPEVRRQLLDGIRRVAESVALSAGIPGELLPVVEVNEQEFTPATWNDPALNRRLLGLYGALLGKANALTVSPVMGGEDFGRYALEDRSVPSVLYWLGAVDPGRHGRATAQGEALPSLHSAEFAPLVRPAIRTGVLTLAAAVLELAPAPPPPAAPGRPPREE